MWELNCEESWPLKNLCFWTVVLEKTLESPLDTRRSIQSILEEISPGYSLEGLMLKLKLQYFGHLMQRLDSLEKTLMLEGIGGRKRRGLQRMRSRNFIGSTKKKKKNPWDYVLIQRINALQHWITTETFECENSASQSLFTLVWSTSNMDLILPVKVWDFNRLSSKQFQAALEF